MKKRVNWKQRVQSLKADMICDCADIDLILDQIKNAKGWLGMTESNLKILQASLALTGKKYCGGA